MWGLRYGISDEGLELLYLPPFEPILGVFSSPFFGLFTEYDASATFQKIGFQERHLFEISSNYRKHIFVFRSLKNIEMSTLNC